MKGSLSVCQKDNFIDTPPPLKRLPNPRTPLYEHRRDPLPPQALQKLWNGKLLADDEGTTGIFIGEDTSSRRNFGVRVEDDATGSKVLRHGVAYVMPSVVLSISEARSRGTS